MATRCALFVVLLSMGISTAVIGLDNTFGETSLGYTIGYPNGWIVERPSDFTVLFTGAAKTASASVNFAIQNVASASIGGQYESTGELLDALKCQLVTEAEDICIYIGDAITVVDTAGHSLIGPQLIVEYILGGDVYKEWLAIVPHSSGDVFYVLTYTALQSNYDQFEPTVLDMVSTWTIGGTVGSSTAPPPPASSTGTGNILVILEDSGHIGPYNYAANTYDKRYYNLVITSPGYVAMAVIDEAGQSISGWIYTPKSVELIHKPGNYSEIYTDSYAVSPGTYQIKVGQDTLITESDFALMVYFSSSPFTVDDLEAAFGTRYQTMP